MPRPPGGVKRDVGGRACTAGVARRLATGRAPCHDRPMGARAMAGLLVAALLPGCAAECQRMEAESRFQRACAHDLDDQLVAAEEGYRASLALEPTSPAANNLGVILAKRGDLAGAERWFREAVTLEDAD